MKSSGHAATWTYAFALVVTVLVVFCVALTQGGRYFPLTLLVLLPVMLSAYVGGLWPGLFSMLLVPFLVQVELPGMDRAFISPNGANALGIAQWNFSFIVTAAIICILNEGLHRMRQRAEARQRLHLSTLSHICDAVVTTDPAGRIDYVNPAACRLLGCAAEQIINQPFSDVFVILDEQSEAAAPVWSMPLLGESRTIQTSTAQVLLRGDGTRIAVEPSIAPVRDANGRVQSVVITIRDNTDRRQVEKVLRERLELQSRVERIAAMSPGVVHEMRFYADGTQELSYASPSFKDVFGIDPTLLRASVIPLRKLIHPDDVDWVFSNIEAGARELKPVHLEHRLITPHRGLRWVMLHSIPTREDDGTIVWHGIFMDVTNQKLSEERLRTSQLQLRAALEAGEMGMISIDLQAGSVELDPTARRLWDLQNEAGAIGISHLLSKLHAAEREVVAEELCKMAGGSQSQHHDYHLLLADGEERWLACRGRTYQHEVTGRIIMHGIIADTTSSRRMEEQRLHSQKLEALGVLAGGIAHDFNNLLLAISGNAKLLLSDLSTGDPLRASVQEIDKAALRAAELVRRILSFSSAQDLAQRGHPTQVRPILDEVLGLARAVLPATVRITTSIPEQLPNVLADSSQIHQTVINLLTNAADAAGNADGLINVDVGVVDVDESLQQLSPDLHRQRYLRISVVDQGKGIDDSVLQRIFDPFFTTKPTGRGTGLGLAIVHGIMKSLDGAVTVHSVAGKGSRFSLYFPVQNRMPVAAAPVHKAQPTGRTAHILYVDDEESLVFLMTRTLERMGHRVTAYTSPEQALHEIEMGNDDFDLIVSDMTMPGMSGIELAERALSLRPDVPFIITSGYLDAADIERARALGVRQMIMKPNTVDELSIALATILQEEVASA
ncbi:MAG: PAS domain S-box protein [Steroidobacteraceae bacterium]